MGDDRMETGIIPVLVDFIRAEKIKLRLRRISASEFWLDDLDESLSAKFVIDDGAHEILFDVFLPKYDVHLNLETLKRVERAESIAEDREQWRLEHTVEDMRLVLDAIGPWARKNKYRLKKKEMI